MAIAAEGRGVNKPNTKQKNKNKERKKKKEFSLQTF